MLNEKGQPIFIDKNGNKLTVRLGQDGKPMKSKDG